MASIVRDGWHDQENALRYQEFVREFPRSYGQLARHLIELADLAPKARVADLACGTGVLTAELIRHVTDANVVGVDSSDAMLVVARRELVGCPIKWHRVEGEAIDTVIGEPVDAVLCNAALWYMKMPEVFVAVRHVLRPGGAFVFNLPRAYLGGLFPPPAPAARPSLAQRMIAIATLYYDFVPSSAPAMARPVHVDALRQMLSQAGFRVERHDVLNTEPAPRSQESWMRVPVFTEQILPSLDYATRMEILQAALAGYSASPTPAHWIAFVSRV